MARHSKQIYFGKKPLVLKTAVIEAGRNRVLMLYRTRQYDKTIPCQVSDVLDKASLKEGHVWVIIDLTDGFGKSRFMVPKDSVLIRHKFMRPMVPFSLENEVRSLEDKIIALGKIAKEELSKLNDVKE